LSRKKIDVFIDVFFETRYKGHGFAMGRQSGWLNAREGSKAVMVVQKKRVLRQSLGQRPVPRFHLSIYLETEYKDTGENTGERRCTLPFSR